MNPPVDIPLLGPNSVWQWTAIQGAAVTLTLVLILKQIKKQSASNIVQTLTLLNNNWNQQGLLVARARLMRRASKEKPPWFDGDAAEIANYFEALGSYVQNELVSKEICWDIFSLRIEGYYALLKGGCVDRQTDCGDASLYEGFTYLAEEMNTISKKRKVAIPSLGNDAFKEFIEHELKCAEAALTPYIPETVVKSAKRG